MRKTWHLILFIAQYCFYYLVTPFSFILYKKKYPWIISERGNDARDNGYTMFKYLTSEHRYINVFFVINKKSADYPKVKAIGKTVSYKSIKHWLLYRVAECRMSTHLASFAPGNYIGEWFKHHKQCGVNVFLQHGITHNEFPSNHFKYNGSDLFICGAKPEFEYISNNYHYPSDNVVYTGFSRFDELHDCNTKNQILIMPSWRSYLEKQTKESFVQSNYFKAYDCLLKNAKLNNELKKRNTTIYFYIHYSLQKFCDCFKHFDSNIVVADFNNYDVQTLLKESKLLITDYSSVFFDFAYMKKPEIFYQFDEDDFYTNHYKRGYFNHKKDGFGRVANNCEELVNYIIETIDNNYILDNQYRKKIENFFPLYDKNNSQRIFNSIIKKIIDKKNGKPNNRATFIILTGDDYGRNNEATLGINKALHKKYIQQTTFMVNRESMCYKNINHSYFHLAALHFNFLEGNKTYDKNGEWFYCVEKEGISKRLISRKTFFKINIEDSKIINVEIENQIKRYKELGFKCIAFDSHGHMHNRLPIAKMIIPKCKQEGFKVARIPANIKHNHPLFDLTYKKFVIHLYKKHFITTDYFCSCYDLIHLNLNSFSGKVLEVMTHPFLQNNSLINRRDIDFDLIYRFLSRYNVKTINYNDLIIMRSKRIKDD